MIGCILLASVDRIGMRSGKNLAPCNRRMNTLQSKCKYDTYLPDLLNFTLEIILLDKGAYKSLKVLQFCFFFKFKVLQKPFTNHVENCFGVKI